MSRDSIAHTIPPTRTGALFETLFGQPAFAAAAAVAGNAAPAQTLVLSGLTRVAKAVVAAVLLRRITRPIVLLTGDNEAAELLAATAAAVLDWLEPGASSSVAVLPAFDCTPYEGRSPHPEILERRAATLWSLAQGRARLLVVPLAAALGRFRAPAVYRSLALEVKPGDEFSPDHLTEHLAGIGYERGEPVAEAGQFSVRGGIVDVFSPEAAWPVRIEFLGDAVESLREFDPATQRSRAAAAAALLLPLTEVRRSAEFFGTLTRRLAERIPKSARTGWTDEVHAPFPGWEFYAPLADPHEHSLFAFFSNPLLLWDEAGERRERGRQIQASWLSGYDETRDALPPRPAPQEVLLSEEEFQEAVKGLARIELEELAVEGARVEPAGGPEADQRISPALFHTLPSRPAPKFRGSLRALVEELRALSQRGENVILALPAPAKAERLLEVLGDSGIPFELAAAGAASPGMAGDSAPACGRVVIAPGSFPEGVVFPEAGLALLSDHDLFGDFGGGATRREKSAAAAFISDLSDLKPGDYVVHVEHGIALYQGLRQLEVDGAARDFMLLVYRDDARLYVPLERLDLVEKYRSTDEGAKPQLDRLGGSSWQTTRKRVQKALRDMARELLRLYAERQMRGGVAYSTDTPWQKEFEDAFPFEETPDQIAALAEIKKDLEGAESMDRLLCGDVGYGKTELALRAAFKVVQDGKQVAVLAPTTVLAFQHFLTFSQRMAAFPVRIEMLSRLRTSAQQKQTVADAEAGKADIVIATHRLLSKDVRFHDLGLLIVDEEQRFGVAAKEKLKSLKSQVDVLTLSATPIPRTLHMALGGLRDLSIIESPPRGRLAIQTTVAAFSPGLIQSAILQEMERRGQVYFVHNRIESIFSMAEAVRKLVPTARLAVVHGQMGERELERAMVKFVEGQYDVLVATALIENGLDIPRANTLIVNHAERFGLADLYQLRGRVGRSERRAYAYFLVPAQDALSAIAKRRLAALKEFSDLGAGFRLAALDLELRGAGNLLGREQHGHLNAIGIDLYLRMLEQTVEELRGAPAQPEVHATINLGVEIKIPHEYIADERQRLKMYKRIAAVSTPEARDAMEAELSDRYGPLPPSVGNLLVYALLKSQAEQLLVEAVERKANHIYFRFHPQTPVPPEAIQKFLRRRKEARFRPEGALEVSLDGDDRSLLAGIRNVLMELQPSE